MCNKPANANATGPTLIPIDPAQPIETQLGQLLLLTLQAIGVYSVEFCIINDQYYYTIYHQ